MNAMLFAMLRNMMPRHGDYRITWSSAPSPTNPKVDEIVIFIGEIKGATVARISIETPK